MFNIFCLRCCYVIKCVLLLAILASSEAVLASTSFFDDGISVADAYERGRTLRAQYKNRLAREYLKFAADQGDSSAAFLYALELQGYQKTIRTSHTVNDYIESAAKHNDLGAVQYLAYRSDQGKQTFWSKKYFNLLENLEAENASSAYLGYFLYFQKLDAEKANLYLEKAIEQLNPVALMIKADHIRNGEGFYFFDYSRLNSALEFYIKGANTGYLPAIKRLVDVLESLKREDESFEWLVKSANKGELASIATVARVLSGNSETYKGIALNLVESKSYYDLYFTYAGTDRFSSLYETMLVELEEVVGRLDEKQLANSDEKFHALKDGIKKPVSSDYYWFDDGYVYSLN
ncbi:hypothetical protein Mar181_2494 [Marinomonas posidonica IVIA-Po-181]|uniref:Sel1 domain protein repeat-containing protein n=1 Tax=Marinomonas posidonica (strain CECT 7376 / NCIMB 14433 / IVIA-Po-181) TaxID=491952 RepID=F6CWW5_MARPP|nr:hypothetical protein Mar181_2494 [Marinomonas posidonica IVIA-Po-181]